MGKQNMKNNAFCGVAEVHPYLEVVIKFFIYLDLPSMPCWQGCSTLTNKI